MSVQIILHLFYNLVWGGERLTSGSERPPRKSPPDLKVRRPFSESSDWIPVSGQYI